MTRLAMAGFSSRNSFKPVATIFREQDTVTSAGEATRFAARGRHDPCVGIRATPIAEAMLALVLMDHFMRQRAQNADVDSPTPDLAAAMPREAPAEPSEP